MLNFKAYHDLAPVLLLGAKRESNCSAVQHAHQKGIIHRDLKPSNIIATGLSVAYAFQAEREKGKAVGAQQLADQRLSESQQSFAHSLQAIDQVRTRVGDKRLNDIPQVQTVQAELLQDAVKFYQTLLEENPGTSIVRYRMALAQRSLGNVESLMGRVPEAEALFRAAHLALAEIQQQQGLLEQADVAYGDAIHFRREFLLHAPPHAKEQHFLADMLVNHAALLLQLDRNEQAESCYREAAGIWKLLADSRQDRGELYLDILKDYKQALIDFDAAIEQTPHLGHWYKRRGLAHFHLSQYDEAICLTAPALTSGILH